MHILYLHQHFALPSGSTGTRSYEMARRWVAAGHKVTLICGRGDICGLPAQKQFEAEGIRVRVVGAAYSQKQGFLRRIGSFLHFMAACTLEGLRVRKVDVIFATSTPLTIGIPAMVLKWCKRIPFVFEVRDQWPEVPIEMGIIRNEAVKRVLLWLEKRIYVSSAAIVALSPGMAEGVRQILRRTQRRILVAPNSSDTELFRPDIDGMPVRKQMQWQDKFVVMHFGTVGRANGLEFLIDAADRLKTEQKIVFVILGSGREKERLERKACERKLANVLFLSNKPKSELPEWVAACDVSTVIFADYPILQHNSANKFFDSLAAGKPVVLNYAGWQKDVLEQHKAGFGAQQHSLDEYVDNLTLLCNDKKLVEEMGCNAAGLAREKFCREYITQDVRLLIESVC